MPSISLNALPVFPDEPLRLDGVLIPDVYWQLGTQYSDRLFARTMDDENDDELGMITWGQVLIDAYHATVYLKSLTRDTTAAITVGILGSSNYRYYAYVVACWLNGWKIIFLSTRNSLSGLKSLLEGVDSSRIIVDESHADTAYSVKDATPSIKQIIPMKNLEELVDKQELPMYVPRVEDAHDSELDSIAYYVHTSGSQGHPKPIPVTHRRFFADGRVRSAAKYAGSPGYAPAPLFHAMGLYGYTHWPMNSGIVPTFIAMRRPPNGRSVIKHLRRIPKAVCMLPPILLEDIARLNSEEIVVLKTTTIIIFGGAPINPKAAESLYKLGIPMVNSYGSSEAGILTEIDFPSDNMIEDWQYVRFIKTRYTIHFVPVDDSDARELVVSHGPDGGPAVINCNNPVGFTSNDLWVPHPAKPGLWKCVGRKDAVTVLSNGEKTDNTQLASLLQEDPSISAVVVFGSAKPLNGVLLLPSAHCLDMDAEEYLDSIWATIERTNALIPKHSRILQQMVIVATREKPFILSDKGSIRAKETLSAYDTEINDAYRRFDTTPANLKAQAPATLEESLELVRNIVHCIAGRQLEDDQNIFEAGLDSLHATQIRAQLLAACGDCEVPYNIVYSHSTIIELSLYVVMCRNEPNTHETTLETKSSRIQLCIDHFTADFPSSASKTDTNYSDATVILTGATGSLGCHLLDGLLGRQHVKKVFCFHRHSSKAAFSNHAELFQKRGIPSTVITENKDKLLCLNVDLTLPDLGLDSKIQDELRQFVTHIVHAAWELNFNWNLKLFEKPCIAPTRHLIDFALTSFLCPDFIFISSVGAVSSYTQENFVPEIPLDDATMAGNEGYGEAKYVAERLVDRASQIGLRAKVVRIGQLSGSTVSGFWEPSEYMPSLFRSSRKLCSIPIDFPDTRWIPTDVAGNCVLDLVFNSDSSSLAYYHIENPTATTWKEVVRLFIAVSQGSIITPVPTKDWIKKLEEAGQETYTGASLGLPLALLQFYSDYALGEYSPRLALDVTRSSQVCPSICYGPVTEALMRSYVRWFEDGV
ncbi:hypothetical protein BDQ12DRAFT_693080 [Crucibulum laeve]|uniref:Carrier domain-containing protein n=1 Tax=Crucibulum laeve TaxID=68775 RepID=A0A5C3LGY8_9AGAR|nr:hypothetical protein BDQ12DRAFT_693080 [Crucibulum laeve]